MTTSNAEVTSVRDLYDAVADEYDQITRHNDYDEWVGLYAGLIERHGAPGERLLDIGAGTGQASIRLAEAGFAVTAVDISAEMLRQARAKPGADAVQFVVTDLRELPDLGTFDVAVALGEPFVYLVGETELAAALRGVARLLAAGGLLIFDLVTAGFCRRYRTYVAVDETADRVTVIRGAEPRQDPRGADYLLDQFTTDDGVTWRRTSQRHSFSYFAPETVDRLLREAGLEPLAVHGLQRGELQETADDEAHRKRFVVARRPA
ncbi:class I SAM-dependent methyltransferase [Winogradskya consettensis]|uniref:Antibiotic biosynthesis protein n=1 Tax=Winogradskya consettensis TaxID=113560 RepID=A0A919SZZ1_9ACTN|nr:class I SAM-dependent methyltransferase [Actinoplanes consettensis]GIM82148.1 antibiotic biosynthesis protein [Actinoplanes consettensis]